MAIFKITPSSDKSENKEVTETNDVNKEEVPGKGLVDTNKIDDNTITLDGPLSQVYTQALNEMYAIAKENATEDLLVITESENLDDKDNDYIYVTDTFAIEHGDNINLFNRLVELTAKRNNIYLCIEHNNNITDKVGNILSVARNMGVNIISNRNKALEMFSNKLRKK